MPTLFQVGFGLTLRFGALAKGAEAEVGSSGREGHAQSSTKTPPSRYRCRYRYGRRCPTKKLEYGYRGHVKERFGAYGAILGICIYV